jgi:DNA-binding transcriptional LysR family regulator
MDVIKLRAFYTVAKYRSISRAARELNYTQPAISAQIRDLEDIFNVKLLEKVGRRIRLSEAGRIILPYVEHLLRDYEQIVTAIPKALHPGKASLRIGASILPAVHLVPELLAAFLKSHPDTGISLQIDKANHIRRMVLDHQLDIGIIGTRKPLPPHSSLEEHFLLKDEMVAVTALDHPFARQMRVSIGELAESPLILPPRDTLTRRSVEERFHKLGYAVNLLFEIANTEAIKSMVSCGLGLSIMCLSSVRREVKAGWLAVIPVENLDLSRQVSLICRPPEASDQVFRDFVDFALKSVTPSPGIAG